MTAPKKESQATAIVRLATDTGAELWHTPAGDAYISIRVNGHRENHRLNSRGSRDYLVRLFYLETGKAPNAAALQDAIATLNGIAKFDGEQHDVHVRVAGNDQCVYLDLADPLWRVVEVTSTGWRVIAHPPVRFRRTRGMLPLPVPATNGSIDVLRPFVNVADDDFPLVAGWQIGALRGRGPFAVLDFLGEQGTGKSSTVRAIRRTIDPHESELRRPPRNTEDVMVAATNSYVVTVDNVSYLPDWLSDDLAVLATGRGLTKECVAIEVDRSLPGLRVVRVLDRLAETVGLPEILVMDNGPEFSGRALDTWAYARGVQLRFIRPGKPTDNAFVESFNGKFRDECLNEHWFASVAEARALIEAWRIDYNTVRPHSALRGATPEQFANSLCGRSPAQTPARAVWKNKETKNEDPKPEDLSLSV
jgi:transposase InsO family protein